MSSEAIKFWDPASGTYHRVTAANPLPVSGGGGGGTVVVSNFPATQPVSATALPLPAGAASAALQTALNTALGPATARAAVVDPAAAADANQLLRGILATLLVIATNTTPTP